ncbi:MAG TPA: hypothetical protein VJZ71_19215 [Phycisphaerae bacterium]|nr:hypothetical protein [Phycisphaerae bacterium]
MKNVWYRWFAYCTPALSLLVLSGCHEDFDEGDGVLAIISGVFELVLGIIEVST